MLEIRRCIGGYEISLQMSWVGGDLHMLCTGGQRAHLGAVTMALPDQNRAGCSASLSSLSAPGHQDAAVSGLLAKLLCKRLNTTVVVCAGIHYDNADHTRIAEIIETVEQMAQTLLEQCPAEQTGMHAETDGAV